MRVTHFIIALSFISGALAYYGDLRINGGGRSGLLEFNSGVNDWGTVCKDGFDDDAGNVACRQLGYLHSSDVSVYEYDYDDDDINVCYTVCYGNEDELTDCYIRTSYCDTCSSGVVSITCTYHSELRINGGGSSGLLQFNRGIYDWGAVCKNGFDDDAGDVACRQLGYVRSSDVSVYAYYYDNAVYVCYTDCDGSEDELTDCNIITTSSCVCSDGVVSITCTNTLTAGMIAGIVVGVLVFIGLVATCAILCICCLVPTCPCYYRSYHTTHTVVVRQPTQPTAQVITATTTNAANYQPPPPAYIPDTGYQPVLPTATTVKY